MKYAMYNNHFIEANQAKRDQKYKCPFCHRGVILHQATLTHRSFFVHANQAANYYNPAETKEHLLGKQQLFNFFKPVFKDVQIERYLPRINQWPDLMFNQTAIEFQCSPIGTRRLKERLAGYAKLHIKSWWLLGDPYYQRHLRPTYLVRFLNYSKQLGFFMLFWRVKNNYLECHYQIREIGSRITYQRRCFNSCIEFLCFIQQSQVHGYVLTRPALLNVVHSDILRNQRRLFHGDKQLMQLQAKINPQHNSLMGCPLICHVPVITFPIFKKKALLWRIWIMLLLNHSVKLSHVYRLVNAQMKFPLKFCQIPNYQKFYQNAFKRYIELLYRFHYLELTHDGKKITRFKMPRWYNNSFDKFKSLK